MGKYAFKNRTISISQTTMKRCLIIVLTFLLIPARGNGQTPDFAVKTGIGIYQGYHFGIDYFYLKNASIGVNIGSRMGLKPSTFYSGYGNGEIQNLLVTIENSFHFGAKVKQGTKAWIFGQHFMYYKAQFFYSNYEVLALIPTIGRVFSLSNSLGLIIEIGPTFGIELSREDLSDGRFNPATNPSHNMFDLRLQIAYTL